MSTKVKLVSLISAFVFVLAIMMVAAMAVPTVTLNMGGSISFTATDLQVTISQGVLANGTVDDSDNKMQEVKIDAYDDGAEELATWLNLNLTFNESGEDMTITFTITNNSKVDDIRATVTVDQGTTDNATVSVTTPSSSSVRIPANDGSQQFVVTFHIDNRNDSASIENFEINIDLEKYEPQVYDYFTFRVNSDDTTVTLTSFNEDLADTTDIVIPATVSQNASGQWIEGDAYTVTDISNGIYSHNGVFYNSGITSIDFPSTLETIGNYAFQYCSGLTGDLDLSNCINLTSIEDNAFEGCSGLTGDLDLSNCINLTSIGERAFWDCSRLTGELVIPEGVTSIGHDAFYSCSGLTSIDLSNCTNLTSIGSSAFYSCSGLTGTLDLSNCTSLTSIGNSTFRGCSGLESITLPSSLTSIDYGAFYGCRGLETLEYKGTIEQWLSIEFGSSWMDDDSHTFIVNGKELINLVVPEGATSIGSNAFYGCSGLTSIDLSNCTSLTSIGSSAFRYCSGLTGALDLGNCTNLTSIGSMAFWYCSGLTSIDLPSSLTSIGSQAFRNCSGLTGTLDLSNCTNLTSIENSAFYGCSGLTSVTINQYVFENVTSSSSCGYILWNIGSGETVLVPANLIDELLLTNEYLDNSGAFTRSATAVDGYYVYTKI